MVVCELIKQRGTLPQGKFPGSVSSTEGPPIDKGGFREDCLLASQKASVLQRELKKERCNRFSFLLFRLWSCSCGGVTRVVAVIRAAFLGSVFGLLDTTFRSAASWGALAAKFDPLVSLRTVGVPQKNTGPGHHAAVGGASCQPAQIDLASKDQFVTGGWNRGSALAHLQLSEVECSGGHLSGNNSREKEERREKREERWPHHSRVASQRGHRSRQLRAHHHQGFLADRNLRAR